MSYIAHVYNVMIASPGDVDEHKELARKLILEWNIVNSKNREIVLLPIDWKYNSSPNMGGRPQNFINEQVLANADILVGIFWSRLGTPTGTYSSGTVEEIDLHIKKGLPTLLYFSGQPVDPERIDFKQYQAVKDLKQQYESQGLFHNFKTLEEFENSFRRHLALTLNGPQFFEPLLINSNNLNQENEAFSLSTEAMELLLTAVNSERGEILHSETRDGIEIISGDRNFIDVQTTRIKAKWKAALSELEMREYVESKNGSIYKVTDMGFRICESLDVDKLLPNASRLELSDDALNLIRRAANKDKGEILYRTTGSKPLLFVDGYNFMPNPTGKIAAKWQSVIEELENHNLIKYDSNKSYSLTKLGFDEAAKFN